MTKRDARWRDCMIRAMHTALSEVYDCGAESEGKTELTVGRFDTTADLKVIDLTELRSGTAFLNSFVEDLKKLVSKDGREHVGVFPSRLQGCVW
jgi:hypothetical protein